jgi:arylformamidase
MLKEVIFLSHEIGTDTPQYGGADDLRIQQGNSIKKGDSANTTILSLTSHVGTHVDVPYHFFSDGQTLTNIPATFWVFRSVQCIDVQCGKDQLIYPSDIENISIRKDTELLLIRTGFEHFRSEAKYWQSNPGLSTDLARLIRKEHNSVRAIGVDFISITARAHRGEGRKAHREFLNQKNHSDIVILIEDMSLKNVTDKVSRVTVLPLMIVGGDGAPCTVIAE